MKRLVLIAALLVLAAGLSAQEIVTLTTPAVQTATSCSVTFIGLELTTNRITVTVQPNVGVQVTKVYDATTTPTGATLLHSLNIGNFSVNSLLKAVYNRLSTDGVCTGTVSGVPQ
jgi:uncharacterized lipoprotein YajG